MSMGGELRLMWNQLIVKPWYTHNCAYSVACGGRKRQKIQDAEICQREVDVLGAEDVLYVVGLKV